MGAIFFCHFQTFPPLSRHSKFSTLLLYSFFFENQALTIKIMDIFAIRLVKIHYMCYNDIEYYQDMEVFSPCASFCVF